MEDKEPIESTEGAKAESQHQCSTSSHTNSNSKGLKENGKTLTVRPLEGVQVPGAADVPNGVTACSASDTSASKPRGLEEDGLKDTITDGKHLEEEAVCNDDVSVNKHTTGVCVNKDATDVCVNKETTDLCVYKHTTGVCVNKDTTDVFVNKETTDLCVNKDTTDLCVNTRSCKASNYLQYDNDREKLSILSYPDEKSNLDNQCTDYKKYGLEMNDITKEDNAWISEESAQTDKKYLDHSFHKSCKFNYETQACPVSNDPNEAPSVTESHDTNDPTNLDNDVISLDDVRNIDAITNITDTNIEPDGEYRVSNGEETVDQQRHFYGQRGDIVDLDAANRGNRRHIEWGPMQDLHPPIPYENRRRYIVRPEDVENHENQQTCVHGRCQDGEYRVSNGEETVDQQRHFYGQRGDIVDLDAANRGNRRHIEWGPMQDLHPPIPYENRRRYIVRPEDVENHENQQTCVHGRCQGVCLVCHYRCARVWCETCDYYFCPECDQSHHCAMGRQGHRRRFF